MMLAEEDPLETILLRAEPSLPVISEMRGDLERRHALARVRDEYAGICRRAKKLENPGLQRHLCILMPFPLQQVSRR